MSFFSDIWHSVTRPFTLAEQLVSDIASGKNVFQAVTQTAEKSFISATGGLSGAIISDTPLKSALEKTSPYTFGVTGRVVKNADLTRDVNNGGDVTFSQTRDFGVGTAENAAIVGAVSTGNFALAAGLASGTQQLDKGNVVGGLAAIGAGAAVGGALGEVGSSAYNTYTDGKSYYDDAKSIYDKFRSELPPQVSGYSSNVSGGGGQVATDSGLVGSGGMLILAAAGVAAYFVLRGKK